MFKPKIKLFLNCVSKSNLVLLLVRGPRGTSASVVTLQHLFHLCSVCAFNPKTIGLFTLVSQLTSTGAIRTSPTKIDTIPTTSVQPSLMSLQLSTAQQYFIYFDINFMSQLQV